MYQKERNKLIGAINHNCWQILKDAKLQDNTKIYGHIHPSNRASVLMVCKHIITDPDDMRIEFDFEPLFSFENQEGKIIFSLSKVNKEYSATL